MTGSNESILIVDDEEMIRLLIFQKLSTQGYSCQTAANAEEATKRLRESPVALVLLDINMPGKSGAVLLPEIVTMYPDTVVIVVSAISDAHIAVQCIRDGAYDYITKPLDLNDLVNNVNRALEHRQLIIENRAYQLHLEEMVAERTAELQQAMGKLEASSLDTIHRLATAAEYRDEDTGNHIKRMSLFCAAIAKELSLDTKEVENLLYASPMHDIGKIGIPDRILLKRGALAPDEWEVMKQHTVIGGRILANSKTDFIRLAEIIALTHHEKWDGSGYPKGLKGDAIPMAGRIVAVADVFDALISKRPYKTAFPIAKSLEIIKENRGRHFDPVVTDAFLAIEDSILSIMTEYQDSEADADSKLLPYMLQAAQQTGILEDARH